MSNARRSANINVMVEAAEKAGRGLVRDFGEVENLQVSKKGPGDFVSTADHKAEKTVRAALEKARPKFGFLMEESGEIKGADATCRWIVDPLDGTTNFLHGIPHWSVSIALEKDGEIVAGVIYDPLRDEVFWAEKGLGAYMNNRRMHVAGRKALSDALVASYPYSEEASAKMVELDRKGMSTRNLGSACLDLCYVAAGRLDGFFCATPLKAWDTAAGSLFVREAKGLVTDLSGGNDYISGGSIVCGNPAIHAALLENFGTARKTTKAAS